MPIYEYYCPQCQGRFRHLARRYDAPAPSCPRCGSTEVTKLISAAAILHSDDHHTQQVREQAKSVPGDDLAAAARFLQDSGRLNDAEGLFGSPAYRELLARRAEGATDADLEDLVPALTQYTGESEAIAAATAAALSGQMLDAVEEHAHQAHDHDHEHEHEHDHDHDHDHHHPTPRPTSPRRAKDLGWG